LKIAAVFALVVALLLGMIAGIGWVDGTIGDGSAAAIDAVTGAEQAYVEFVIARLESAGTNMGNLGYLITNPEFGNTDWKMKVYLVVNQLQAAFADVADLEPSERLQPFQDASVDALSHAAKFGELAEDMLAAESTEMSEEAVKELVAANNAFAEAEELLLEFLEAHPLPDVSEQASGESQ